MRTFLFHATGVDPYENLAVEEALLARVEANDCILYLWQNERTVVIGKNQSALRECRTTLLQQEGGRLARRLTGGGAVYHDLGNLNFSFLAGNAVYDEARQTGVLLRALHELGIPAERTGRNDLLAAGRKFSGNAYLHRKARACHHGTLMVNVELARAERYLSPPQAKLAARGVDSVRSRVINLQELAPELTVSKLAVAVEAAFAEEYGTPILLPGAALDPTAVRRLAERNAAPEWIYGEAMHADLSLEGRFPWGGVELLLTLAGNRILACRVYTDAMDETLSAHIQTALTGAALTPQALEAALGDTGHAQELLQLFPF